eukprot:15462238-Alexandrium_andersonii.AAC.1
MATERKLRTAEPAERGQRPRWHHAAARCACGQGPSDEKSHSSEALHKSCWLAADWARRALTP